MKTILKPKFEIKDYLDTRFTNVSSIIIKVTNRCNLNCHYCYENITQGEDMPIETFKKLIDKIIATASKKTILLVFHGGEPTLLKNEWFIEAVEYADKAAEKYSKKFNFSVQTNLFDIDHLKLNLFKYLNISLGVSIDGYPGLITMRGNNNKVIENIKLAQSLDIKVGIITTINHSNFHRFSEICYFIQNNLKIKHFKANVINSVGIGAALPLLKPEQVFIAYKSIIDFIIESKGLGLIEENIQVEILRFFAEPDELIRLSKTLCRTKKCAAGSRVIGITTEGNILPCGRFQWNDPSYVLGNIHDTNFSNYEKEFEIRVDNFHSLVSNRWNDCPNCKANKICSYGCQAFIVRSDEQINIDCIPTKLKYEYLLERSKELENIYETWNLKQQLKGKFLAYSDHHDSHYSDNKYDDDSWYDYDHYPDHGD